MKTAYFRVDSSLEIGAGHVMRCLTLADELKIRGVESVFITREHLGNLNTLISERGYLVHSLPLRANFNEQAKSRHLNWLGETWEIDADQTLNLIGSRFADFLIIDHYTIDHKWECRLKPWVGKMAVIDDLANRKHVCNLLIDQNLGSSASHYLPLVPKDAILLIGAKYALIRPEFALLRPYSLTRRADWELKKITVSMGGFDKGDVSSEILESLSLCSMPAGVEVNVVLGKSAPHIDRVRKLALQMPYKTTLHVGVSNMAQLLADSDLLIGAGGSTVWEACCLGLPSILKALADNQKKSVDQLSNLGCVLAFDDLLPTIQDLSEKISKMAAHNQLEKMSKACIGVTNGLGVNLVSKELINLNSRR